MKLDGIDIFAVHVTGDLYDDYVENVTVSVQGIEVCEENRSVVAQLLRHCADTVDAGAPFQLLSKREH